MQKNMTEHIKILIVEDEPATARTLKIFLEANHYSVVGIAHNKTQALIMLKTQKPDLAILDIMLDNKPDGIDIGAYIKENVGIPFIFLTSHSQKTVIDIAKNVHPSSYLIKPFNKDLIYASVEIALTNAMSPLPPESLPPVLDSLFVKQKDYFIKVNLDEIIFLQADEHYTHIIVPDRKLTIKQGLGELTGRLNKFFIRVHKSYIVNLQKVKAVGTNDILLMDDQGIPIGRAYRKDLLEKINLVV
jgi:two-component system, LytTR family, response regulator LytT